jgi:hypothetical protein
MHIYTDVIGGGFSVKLSCLKHKRKEEYTWDFSGTVLRTEQLGKPRRKFEYDIKKGFITECDGMDWINLAEDRDQGRAIVNTVINTRFHKMLENSWVAKGLTASEDALSSTEMVKHIQCGLNAKKMLRY